jgi:hypothetical protein
MIRTSGTEHPLFPRYHQLGSVRKIVADARALGAGQNYLVEHSAGSGKSNSIGWLAHRLASLHSENDETVFDTVVVITSRPVLDQPLLHTMYVDKKLSGVRAVQTLSRLNRTCAGKSDTFVLDFLNDPDVIQKAFQPYYGATLVSAATDPNLAYDLKNDLDKANVYWQSEIEAFCKSFFTADHKNPTKTHAELYQHIGPAVDRFKALDDNERKEFFDQLSKFVRLYAYLMLISPVSDVRVEMLFTYGRFLLRYIDEGKHTDPLKLDDDVALLHYRIQKKSEGSIQLMPGEVELPPSWKEGKPAGKGDPAKEKLSAIIDLLNDKFTSRRIRSTRQTSCSSSRSSTRWPRTKGSLRRRRRTRWRTTSSDSRTRGTRS